MEPQRDDTRILADDDMSSLACTRPSTSSSCAAIILPS